MDCPAAERRRHPRIAVERTCKVYDPRSRRYLAGRTRNVSTGGMLIELDRSLPLEPGDALYMVVAPVEGAIITRTDFTSVKVRRAQERQVALQVAVADSVAA